MGALSTILAAATIVAPAPGELGFYIDRKPTAQEASANYTAQKFEPRIGCYIGAFLDLDSTNTDTYVDQVGKTRRLPRSFEEKTGREHATYFYYMGYGSRTAHDWIARLGNDGKIVHIALEPNNGLEWVKNDAYLVNLAKAFAESRTPIFLRFASEMNGPWVKYSGNAKLYREKFRLVAEVMKEHAPNVAMVWCPYATPTTPIKQFYPGNDVVDWIGVNMYSVTYHNQNKNQPAKHIHPTEMLDYVYRVYSKYKPIMIGEFGATHFSALENKSTAEFANRSILALYSALPRKYPRVKCINYFNANNLVLDHRKNNNYAVTQNPSVLQTYKSAVASPYFLSYVVDQNGYPQPNPYAVPVSGEAPTALETLPETPLPIKAGQTLSGKIMLSGWVKDHSGATTLRFQVDGRTFHHGKTKGEWQVELDTRKLTNGPHTLQLTAEQNGKATATQTIKVKVNN